ncbi:MAG: type IV pilus biogenesis protein PilM [Desulfovibrionaceae bacterium]|nr:type IV pilus biogenesis protein PilM [Desulfovibrionaceae bacterium]
MKALAVLAFTFGIMAMFDFGRYRMDDAHLAQAVALNYVIYRNEVMRYVLSTGQTTPGDISLASLSLPAGWTQLRQWHARIQNGCLYVWGPASDEEVAAARDLLFGSLAVGQAESGKLTPGGSALPAFVSQGNLASVIDLGGGS